MDLRWGLAELRSIELNQNLSLLLRTFRVAETMSVTRGFVMQVLFLQHSVGGFSLLLIHMWFN